MKANTNIYSKDEERWVGLYLGNALEMNWEVLDK